jgi:hypothetical protein
MYEPIDGFQRTWATTSHDSPSKEDEWGYVGRRQWKAHKIMFRWGRGKDTLETSEKGRRLRLRDTEKGGGSEQG